MFNSRLHTSVWWLESPRVESESQPPQPTHALHPFLVPPISSAFLPTTDMILSATSLPPHRHPFSGAAKAERPLYFEKSERDRHSHAALASAALDDLEPVLFPPDEEKGRKFKPTRSAPAIFSVTLVEPTASTFAPASPAPVSDGEDEDWPPGCADDDASITSASAEQDDEDVLASQHARREADRQRAVWDAALQKALDAGEPSTDIDLK